MLCRIFLKLAGMSVTAGVLVLAILAVIALALYLRHRAHQKDSELAWREMLSNVMVQNMDSVYLLWDMRTHKTRYVSPNIERILGISADINDHPLKKIVALEADKSTLWGMELQKIPYGSSIMCECWMTPLNGDKQPKLFQKTAYDWIFFLLHLTFQKPLVVFKTFPAV